MDLEAEIFEFMQVSPNPKVFPAQEALVAAGRADLAGAIAKQGGWLVMGWDLEEKLGVSDDLEEALEHNSRISKQGQGQGRSGYGEKSTYAPFSNSDGGPPQGVWHANEQLLMENPSSLSHAVASSSGRLIESKAMEGPGKIQKVNGQSSWNSYILCPGDTLPVSILVKKFSGGNGSSHSTVSFRTTGRLSQHPRAAEIVSNKRERRGGHASCEILANEDVKKRTISPNDILVYPEIQNLSMDAVGTRTLMNKLQSDAENDTQKLLRQRPQHLESNFTACQSFKSEPNILPHKCEVNFPEDVDSLSGVSESQENEIINAQDKLQLIQANLTALVRKMVLEIKKSEKMIEEERKRVNSIRTSLGVLRTAYIVWARTGLEVFLMGSFNGWSSPLRMVRSKSGLFSLYLKLYPGRYEIKFIVDRVWKVDPLRPIVHNNGFQNNLLIIE